MTWRRCPLVPCTGHEFIAIPLNTFLGKIAIYCGLGPPKVPIVVRPSGREAQIMADPSCRRLA